LYRDFVNGGTFTFELGAISSSNADFTNMPSGTIDILTTGGTFGLSTNSTVYNNGLLVKSAGDGVSSISNHFRNAGVVEVQTGILEFYGSYSLTHVQTAGQTILNGGNISVTSPGKYEIQGGNLTGEGTVFGEVVNSGGSVEPGFSPGTLTIDGDYTQHAGGVLTIEADGLTPDTEHGQLIVTGTATIDGALVVEFINDYLPSVGDSFVVLTAGTLTGTFPLVIGPGSLSASYDNNEVRVTVNEEVCGPIHDADFDSDCDVDLDDASTLMVCLDGPWSITTPACILTDLDWNGHTDLRDFSMLQGCFSGADVPTSCAGP
jgi:hypothetical protein